MANFITAGILTANLIKTGILQASNGKTSINMETGECSMNGTYTSEWTRYDGTGKITLNPNGITFSWNGNHRGSMYLGVNNETTVSSNAYALHFKNFSGDYTASGKDILFSWMDDDGKIHTHTDFLSVSDTWSGTVELSGLKLKFKYGLLMDVINT